MTRAYTVVRVFTRDGEGGNPLGVVRDIDGLDAAAMQAIASRLGYSETIFIEPSADAPFVRIFTPVEELPFAGHPLVGAAWVLTSDGEHCERLRYRGGSGGIRREGGLVWVDLQQRARVLPVADAGSFVDRAGVRGATKVDRVALPLEYVLVRLGTEDAVGAAAPDMEVLAERFGTMLYARHGDRVKARFFAPASGVPEDPATGSAAVALAAVCAHEGERAGRLSVLQGDEVARPSQIEVAWRGAGAALGGGVVLDASGEIRS